MTYFKQPKNLKLHATYVSISRFAIDSKTPQSSKDEKTGFSINKGNLYRISFEIVSRCSEVGLETIAKSIDTPLMSSRVKTFETPGTTSAQ